LKIYLQPVRPTEFSLIFKQHLEKLQRDLSSRFENVQSQAVLEKMTKRLISEKSSKLHFRVEKKKMLKRNLGFMDMTSTEPCCYLLSRDLSLLGLSYTYYNCTASYRPFLSKETPTAYATHRKSGQRRKRHRTRCMRIESMLT
jgi:hypothetical protein